MAYLSEEQPDALLQCDRQSFDISSRQFDPGLEGAAKKQQMASGGAKPQFVIGISLVLYYHAETRYNANLEMYPYIYAQACSTTFFVSGK